MQWSHHTLREWDELSGDEQARVIALYRVYHRVEAVMSHEASKK